MKARKRDFLLLAMAGVALWEGAHVLLGGGVLPSPWATALRLVHLLGERGFWLDIGESAQAIVTAILITWVLGVTAGVLLGFGRLAGDVIEPMIVTFHAIPKVVLYPIMLLLFGLSMSARIAFGVIHGVVPVTLFTMTVVRGLPPILLKSARAMRLSTADLFLDVLVPAALPGIVTGMRLGASMTLLGVLIGEMFASKRGLGFRLMSAIGNDDAPTITAVAVLVATIALCLNAVLHVADRRLHERR